MQQGFLLIIIQIFFTKKGRQTKFVSPFVIKMIGYVGYIIKNPDIPMPVLFSDAEEMMKSGVVDAVIINMVFTIFISTLPA